VCVSGWYDEGETEIEGHVYRVNGSVRIYSLLFSSKEIARVQYDDDNNCKETTEHFVLPSRTIMNYQALVCHLTGLYRFLSLSRLFS
jgi:hypothetical protein